MISVNELKRYLVAAVRRHEVKASDPVLLMIRTPDGLLSATCEINTVKAQEGKDRTALVIDATRIN